MYGLVCQTLIFKQELFSRFHSKELPLFKDKNELIPNEPVVGYDNDSMDHKDKHTIIDVYGDKKMGYTDKHHHDVVSFGMSRASSLSSRSHNDDSPTNSELSERWIDNVDAKYAFSISYL